MIAPPYPRLRRRRSDSAYIKVTGVLPAFKASLKLRAELMGLSLSQHILALIKAGDKAQAQQWAKAKKAAQGKVASP
jgi:hypothetical protein